MGQNTVLDFVRFLFLLEGYGLIVASAETVKQLETIAMTYWL